MSVLLIEDSPGDVRLAREAFREANESLALHVATDGVEAMAFLIGREICRLCPPGPYLLDLNLPGWMAVRWLALSKMTT